MLYLDISPAHRLDEIVGIENKWPPERTRDWNDWWIHTHIAAATSSAGVVRKQDGERHPRLIPQRNKWHLDTHHELYKSSPKEGLRIRSGMKMSSRIYLQCAWFMIGITVLWRGWPKLDVPHTTVRRFTHKSRHLDQKCKTKRCAVFAITNRKLESQDDSIIERQAARWLRTSIGHDIHHR
jgi:hypothetical protein